MKWKWKGREKKLSISIPWRRIIIIREKASFQQKYIHLRVKSFICIALFNFFETKQAVLLIILVPSFFYSSLRRSLRQYHLSTKSGHVLHNRNNTATALISFSWFSQYLYFMNTKRSWKNNKKCSSKEKKRTRKTVPFYVFFLSVVSHSIQLTRRQWVFTFSSHSAHNRTEITSKTKSYWRTDQLVMLRKSLIYCDGHSIN